MADSSEYPRNILKLSFGITQMAAYANNLYVYVFVKNMEMFTGLILYIRLLIKLRIINIKYSIQLFVKEINGYSIIWSHIRRFYNNRAKTALLGRKKKTLSSVLLY